MLLRGDGWCALVCAGAHLLHDEPLEQDCGDCERQAVHQEAGHKRGQEPKDAGLGARPDEGVEASTCSAHQRLPSRKSKIRMTPLNGKHCKCEDPKSQ